MKEFEGLDDYSGVMKQIDANEEGASLALSNWLLKRYHPKSVIDVGCGTGVYLLPFAAAGVKTVGIDGETTAGGRLDRSKTEFIFVDLRFPITLEGVESDLVMCIEVAEHLHHEFASVLINSLCKLGPRICFSAAKPGQAGTNHHNCQDFHTYWLPRFQLHGYQLDIADTNTLIRFTEQTPAFNTAPWLRDNLRILVKG